MALQALATLAALSQPHDIDLTVRADRADGGGVVAVFRIDHDNHLLHQSRQVCWRCPEPSQAPPTDAADLT